MDVENSNLSPRMPKLVVNLAEDSDDDETIFYLNDSDREEDCFNFLCMLRNM